VSFLDLSGFHRAEKQRLTAEAMSRQEPMIYVAELRLAIDLVNLTCCGGPGGYVAGGIKSGAGEEGQRFLPRY